MQFCDHVRVRMKSSCGGHFVIFILFFGVIGPAEAVDFIVA
jgi:hypothetical protein